MTQEENEKLMYSSQEDQTFYLNAVRDLPTLAGLNGTGKDKFGIPLPFGTGPHSLRCLREIVEIVKPEFIFSIGTNMGYGDAMLLELAPDAGLVSCDISYKDETIIAAQILTERYAPRFAYLNRTEKEFLPFVEKMKFDLCFVDGSHEKVDVIEDIELCLKLKIPYIAFDDIIKDFGFAQDAINEFLDKLELVKELGNIGLYKNKAA